MGTMALKNVFDTKQPWHRERKFPPHKPFILLQELIIMCARSLLCCTWGEDGASIFEPVTDTYIQKPAFVYTNALVVE
jgi:hypothetical protein